MTIGIANKFAKFHAKRLDQSKNIPKRFRRGGGLLFFETPDISIFLWIQNFPLWANLYQKLQFFS